MNTLKKEAHILDRMMLMLDEYSVRYVVEQDEKFGDYIEGLYAQIYDKSRQLRST
jgi:hypothetical protein